MKTVEAKVDIPRLGGLRKRADSSRRPLFNHLRDSSWSWLLKNVVLPMDYSYGRKTMRRLRFLEEAQRWPQELLHEHRNNSLRDLIKVAYREVPFYRELMDHAGVKPEHISGLECLPKIPISTKEMLRAGYPSLTTRSTGQKTYEASSSGSTGSNFCVREDAETAAHYRASFLLSLEWAGWNLGDPHLQTGMTTKRSLRRQLKDLFLRCHYVSAFDLSNERLDQTLALLERSKLEHLWGYPGSLFFIAKRAIEKGWNKPLRSVVTWGDTLYPNYRKTIETTFSAKVFDTYGCGEGIQVAAQCGSSDYYHVHSLDVVVECVDDNGKPVPDGQPGHLLLTRLHPGPMPLIRYQVGDIGVLARKKRCECGRGYELMQSVQGRDTDVVVTPSGNRLIVHFFTGVLEYFKEIDSFQVVQDELSAITVRIVPCGSFSNDTSAKIIALLRQKGASDLKINIEMVDKIPVQASGKRRFVISKVSKPVFNQLQMP